jgi:hypothetical protein
MPLVKIGVRQIEIVDIGIHIFPPAQGAGNLIHQPGRRQGADLAGGPLVEILQPQLARGDRRDQPQGQDIEAVRPALGRAQLDMQVEQAVAGQLAGQHSEKEARVEIGRDDWGLVKRKPDRRHFGNRIHAAGGLQRLTKRFPF